MTQGRSPKEMHNNRKADEWLYGIAFTLAIGLVLLSLFGCARPVYDLPLACGGVAKVHPGDVSACRRGEPACTRADRIYILDDSDKGMLAHEAHHACGLGHGPWIQRNGQWCAVVRTNGPVLKDGDWICKNQHGQFVQG